MPGDKVSISVLANEKHTFDGWYAFIIPITPDMHADCQEAAKHIVKFNTANRIRMDQTV